MSTCAVLKILGRIKRPGFFADVQAQKLLAKLTFHFCRAVVLFKREMRYSAFSLRKSSTRVALPSERLMVCGSTRRTLAETPKKSLMLF